MIISYKSLSRIGGRPENQDFFGTTKTDFGELFVACDGMGGLSHGRKAAKIAVNCLLERFEKANEDNVIHTIEQSLNEINAELWHTDRANRMGTTVAALLIMSTKAISFHVGDSRIYQIRDGKVIFRTFDHSHVFEMVRAEILTEEQARLSSKSNIVTRALGISSNVKVDISDDLDIQQGDRFLICTDGIWNSMPECELVESINRESPIGETLTNLVESIDAIGFAKGGKHDNMTAVLIEVR